VWSSTNGIEFSACGGASSCIVLTDTAGEASTWVTPTATGAGTITAELAPASYSPAQMQQTTLVGIETTLDLAAIVPTRWIAKGATLGVPLTVEALDLGVPQANVAIKFTVTNGAASLSSSTATTNSSGLASVTAQVTSLTATVQVSACVSPANSPCQTFTLFAVPASAWKLEAVSGTIQVVPNGQPFQPLVMRVTDGSSADNPVIGVNVTFVTTLERNPQGPGGGPPPGGDFAGQDDMPVILGTSQTQVITGQDGLASIVPTVGSLGPCNAFITVTAGSATAQFELENVDPLTQQQPPKKSGGASAARSTMHFDAASASAQSPVAASILFAVPQEMPSADQPALACSDSGQEAPCEAASDSAASGTPDVAQPSIATPTPEGPQVQSGPQLALPDVKPAAEPVQPASKTAPASRADTPDTATSVPAAQPAAAALLDDKRSCRFAEEE